MREITFREAIREALAEEMRKDERVFLFGEDIGVWGGCFGVTSGLIDEFGEDRVRNTPISESAIAGAAIGAAIGGLRPVAEIMFMDFITVAMDQLANQAAKMRYMFGGQLTMPFTVRTTVGACNSAAAHHSQTLEAWFFHTPGLKLVIPSTPYDAKGLLKAAIRDENPVLYLEHKMLYDVSGPVPEGDYVVPLGKAEVKLEGKDVTVIATGAMVGKALEAASVLRNEGVSVEVVDPRSLVPLDSQTLLNSVTKTRRVVVAEEAVKRGGVGAEFVAMIAEEAFDSLDAPIKRIGAPSVPVPFSPVLERAGIPGVEHILAAVRDVVG